MERELTIVVDGMGGDNAPACNIEGVVNALNEREGFRIIMTGDEEALMQGLSSYRYPKERLTIRPTTQVIAMAEPPVSAIHGKKDSSIVVGMGLVRKGEADAFVSAGSTGAVLVGGQLLVGRLKGVHRPPLACIIPTEKGMTCVVDCGANVDARPEWLIQFARMGSVYVENMLGIKAPTVGLLNIGAEEEKGNALVKETMPQLKACPDIHFTGSVEARDVPSGAVDIVVTDAFSGNVLLKMYEGTASALLHIIKKTLKSSVKTMIGGALIQGALKETLKRYDASNYGGAPLLGLKGLVVKAHGSSSAAEICTSIFQCLEFSEKDINGKIRRALEDAAVKAEA
ncbi:MAG: phosphate acyltransferase PlsX [Lachnospiraceae bacterium]|nr:phosphate acyltransferase PlsX [Lachnospiraceae bacterium]